MPNNTSPNPNPGNPHPTYGQQINGVVNSGKALANHVKNDAQNMYYNAHRGVTNAVDKGLTSAMNNKNVRRVGSTARRLPYSAANAGLGVVDKGLSGLINTGQAVNTAGTWAANKTNQAYQAAKPLAVGAVTKGKDIVNNMADKGVNAYNNLYKNPTQHLIDSTMENERRRAQAAPTAPQYDAAVRDLIKRHPEYASKFKNLPKTPVQSSSTSAADTGGRVAGALAGTAKGLYDNLKSVPKRLANTFGVGGDPNLADSDILAPRGSLMTQAIKNAPYVKNTSDSRATVYGQKAPSTGELALAQQQLFAKHPELRQKMLANSTPPKPSPVEPPTPKPTPVATPKPTPVATPKPTPPPAAPQRYTSVPPGATATPTPGSKQPRQGEVITGNPPPAQPLDRQEPPEFDQYGSMPAGLLPGEGQYDQMPPEFDEDQYGTPASAQVSPATPPGNPPSTSKTTPAATAAAVATGKSLSQPPARSGSGWGYANPIADVARTGSNAVIDTAKLSGNILKNTGQGLTNTVTDLGKDTAGIFTNAAKGDLAGTGKSAWNLVSHPFTNLYHTLAGTSSEAAKDLTTGTGHLVKGTGDTLYDTLATPVKAAQNAYQASTGQNVTLPQVRNNQVQQPVSHTGGYFNPLNW